MHKKNSGGMTKEQYFTERPCPTCGRHMDKAFLESKWRERSRRISERLTKRGRAIAPYGEIQELLAKGLSHRQIARIIPCSLATVSRARQLMKPILESIEQPSRIEIL